MSRLSGLFENRSSLALMKHLDEAIAQGERCVRKMLQKKSLCLAARPGRTSGVAPRGH